jgi:protein-S-isoprenylcysteine O-methyltransferase Ste14
MYFFLIPLLIGFAFNWASAFTHFFSKRWGDRGGRLASLILRNVLGIPVWVIGLILAAREPAPRFFGQTLLAEILGWLLMAAGTILMVWGLLFLRLRSFRPTEKDTLVSRGIFRYIRHPIYSGLLLDLIALILMRPTMPALLACVLGWGFVFIQARFEELDLAQRIPAYREYMDKVPRFFPHLGNK